MFEGAVVDDPGLDEAGWVEPQRVGLSRCAPSGWLALELDYGTVEVDRLGDPDLVETMIGLERVAGWAQARQARVLAELARRRPSDARDPQARRSDRPCRLSQYAPDEVGLALRLSRQSAAGRLAMASTLAQRLPETLGAWESGRIDYLKARAITETSYLLPTELGAALQRRVLPRAGAQTLAQLRAALSRAVLVLDPDGAEERHRQARRERRVVINPDAEGMATLWALLSAPDAVAVYQRLTLLARGLGATDPRAMDARRADLLVALLTGAITTDTEPPEAPPAADPPPNDTPPTDATPAGETPSAEAPSAEAPSAETPSAGDDSADSPPAHGSQRTGRDVGRGAGRGPGKPLVQVTVSLSTLLGLDELPGELAGYGPIPAALAREIATDATWRRLVTDPLSGAILDYGRTTYTPPAGLADFVRARDRYCRSPICRQGAATADLDHTVPYPEGPTSEQNLQAGCRHDHLIKTFAPGWEVEQHSDGTITWTTPTGHRYTSHPHDYRPDPPPEPGPGRRPEPDNDPDPPPF